MNDVYTLYTRSNFDGLVCAALLKEINLIDDICFVHPKDIQDGKIQLFQDGKIQYITASLPYTEWVYMAFDHHSSELVRTKEVKENYIIEPASPSSARIIYEYYGGKSKFSDNLNNIMQLVDSADCTDFGEEDILNPSSWVLLNYLMDPRTGLGRFKNFRISNYDLMLKLVDMLSHMTIDEILNDPDVQERVDLYFSQQDKFKEQIKRCTKTDWYTAVLDLRNEETIYVGNRFMIYALFPEIVLSIHVLNGKQNQNTVLAVGKSILNKHCCPIDIGALMYEYKGGGGHMNAGTCQINNDEADQVIRELVDKLNTMQDAATGQQ